MAWIKAYDWEHKTWPWHQKVRIGTDLQAAVARGVAGLFGIRDLEVRFGGRSISRAYGTRSIRLAGGRDGTVPLGVILHEVAHLVNARLYGGDGHRGTFRKALIKVYCESQAGLSRVLRSAKAAADSERAAGERVAARAARDAQRRADRKAERGTTEHRADLAAKRVVRLERRIKRLTTMLKSARRSLAALDRSLELKRRAAEALGVAANA